MSVELIQTPPQVQEAIESNETVVIHYTDGEPSPFKFIIYDLAGVRPNVRFYIVDSDYIRDDLKPSPSTVIYKNGTPVAAAPPNPTVIKAIIEDTT